MIQVCFNYRLTLFKKLIIKRIIESTNIIIIDEYRLIVYAGCKLYTHSKKKIIGLEFDNLLKVPNKNFI